MTTRKARIESRKRKIVARHAWSVWQAAHPSWQEWIRETALSQPLWLSTEERSE